MLLALITLLPAAAGDPPAWGTLFADLGATVNDSLTSVLPVAAVIFGVLASVGIVFRVFRKAGVK